MVGEHELSERQNIVSKHPERADALGCKGVDSYYVAVYNTAIDFNLNITNAVPCVSFFDTCSTWPTYLTRRLRPELASAMEQVSFNIHKPH